MSDDLKDALSGRVLRREENGYEGDYSGGSSYWERRRALSLYDDGTFYLDEQSFTTISSGGMSLPSENRETAQGTWTVQDVEGRPALALWNEDDTSLTWWHVAHDVSDPGAVYLDGEPWSRALLS